MLAALRQAPRRYRLPPLPAGAPQARAAGIDAALTFAIEAARTGQPAPDAVRELFTWALGAFIRAAMAPAGGDPSFQALVLQAHDAQVREFVRLSAEALSDRRALRSLTDAIAHPGKTRALPPGPARDALARLHALAASQAWTDLRAALQDVDMLQGSAALQGGDPPQHGDAAQPAALETIRTSTALQRLLRRDALLANPAVQRYLALCEQRGPAAGSRAAAAQGRSAARAGAEAERATIEAFRQLAALLQPHAPAACRVLRSLRPPSGFPGERGKAKDEWDAAIACGPEILLLAEVKAAPAAASSDFSRLHRGLQRLAQAQADQAYDFASADGPVRILGASLRELQPPARGLPAHVIYCCTAPAEAQPQWLAAASKAVLAAEPASLAYAQQLAQGGAPDDAQLQPVWEALTHAPRLRATLHQDATARLVRAAMLQPQDLVDGLAAPGRQRGPGA